MTPVQFVVFVVIFVVLESSMRFLCARVFKAWGKIVIHVPAGHDDLDHYVTVYKDLDLGFTLVLDEAHDFGSVVKARKAVRELEKDGLKGARILEVCSVHKTGWRKSVPW
jgi:hypothetical protein